MIWSGYVTTIIIRQQKMWREREMFKKGRKREAKGLAVVYFIIGLIILLIILAVIYFALVELDYSDRMKDPDATVRSYVEMTPEPQEIEMTDEDAPEEAESPLEVDLTTPTDTPEPTPTPTPEPTATPEPTPSPTPVPPTMLAQPRTAGFTLPGTTAQNCQAAITKCAVSAADNNKYMYLAGYGFINDAAFDASKMQAFLIVSQTKTNQLIAYQLTMKPGISGVAHDGALCQNAASSDFEVCFDVSTLYTEDIYNLGLVIGYKPPKKRKATFAYYPFPSDVNFTVLAGQVVEPVKVADSAAAAPAGVIGVADVGNPEGDTAISSDANAALLGVQTATVKPGEAAPLTDSGFNTSEPEDLTPEAARNAPANATIPTVTQQPTLENAVANMQDPAIIQQQIMQNQMGIG